MQIVIFSSPTREKLLNVLLSELKGYDVHIIDSHETFGKENFYKRWNEARQVCISSPHNDYLILPDDVSVLCMTEIEALHKRFRGKYFVCSIISDNREACWGSKPNHRNKFNTATHEYTDVNFFDCGGVTNRYTMNLLEVRKMPNKWFDSPIKSSGVGFQLTKIMQRHQIPMFKSFPSLAYHGTHESVMHREHRLDNPLISVSRPKVIIGIATFKGREEYLKNTIRSLRNQCDVIRIYDNEVREVDLTDNGKFYFLKEYTEPIYYFSCDDDIIYPPTYVQDMIQAIEKHGTIVTHHGRILKHGAVKYYRGGHTQFRCTGDQKETRLIDVAGTGVTAFRTDYFNPTELYKSEHKRMSDIIFSLEARKQGKKITVLPHSKGYIVAQPVPNEQTIFVTELDNDSIQTELCATILSLSSL